MSLQSTLITEILDNTFPSGSTIKVGLLNSSNAEAGYTSYARQTVTKSAASSDTVQFSGSGTANAIEFPAVDSGQTTNVKNYGIYRDTGAGEVLIAIGSFAGAQKTLSGGQQAKITDGAITVKVG